MSSALEHAAKRSTALRTTRTVTSIPSIEQNISTKIAADLYIHIYSRMSLQTFCSTLLWLFIMYTWIGELSANQQQSGYSATHRTCGDRVVAVSGVIQSPNYVDGANCPNSVYCNWHIAVPYGHMKLQFNTFDLETCADCSCERLEIYDVRVSRTRPVRTLCGTEIPSDFVASSKAIQVKFISDRAASHAGFAATWSVTSDPSLSSEQCGGDFTSSSGVIQSPSYGTGDYPNHSECEWRIQVPSRYVRLTFLDLALEECDGCSCDRVEIYSSLSSTVPARTICGSDLTELPVYTVPNTEMKVKFISDYSITGRGFQARWSAEGSVATTAPPVCGGDLLGTSGVIRSPNFPSENYPHNAECEWGIGLHPGQTFRLHFNFFDVQYCSGCSCDFVEVYNSANEAVPIAHLCAHSTPDDIVVTGGRAIVRFYSNYDINYQGFEAVWSVTPEFTTSTRSPATTSTRPVPDVTPPATTTTSATTTTPATATTSASSESGGCGQLFLEDSGVIQSPNFGNAREYPDHSDCEWTIIADENKVVRLTFIAFALETCNNCDCDRFEIIENDEIKNTKCGSNLPGVYTSTSSDVTIKFVSDWSVTARGFSVRFEAIERDIGAIPPLPPTFPPITNATCGQPAIQPAFSRVIGGQEARENSWPWQISLRKTRTRGHTCGGSIIGDRWVVTAAHCVEGHTRRSLYVVTGDHDLTNSSPLENEYVISRIYSHQDFHTGTLDNDIALLKLSRNIVQSNAVSPVCLTERETPDSFLCALTGWGDTLGGGDENRLQQVQLRTISQETCQRDDWNGAGVTENMLCAGRAEGGQGPCHGDSGGPLVCKIHETWRLHGIVSWGYECGGVKSPGVFTRVSKYLEWIGHIVNSAELPAVGQNECTSLYEPVLLDHPSQVIASPGYPVGQEYPNHAACAWRITSPRDHLVITLHFEDFRLEEEDQCRFDRVTVYDGPTMDSPVLAVLCGFNLPADITGTSSVLYVTFETDDSISNSGFRIRHTLGVPVVTQPTTTISIPTADPVPHYGQCGQTPYSTPSVFIVGGVEATPHAYPWMVSLQTRAGDPFCGGTVVGRRWVVTAAHCVIGDEPSMHQVVIGEHRLFQDDSVEKTIYLSDIIVHPDYNSRRTNNDIALLKLAEDIDYDVTVRPACIPAAAGSDGLVCVTTGWGSTLGTGNSNVLNEVDVPIISTAVCNQTGWYGGVLTDKMLCAGYPEGNKDSCQGDSGGPLVCRVGGAWYLHGVTSWGFGCAEPRNPGIYTRVAEYGDWIAFYTDGEVIPTY